MGGSMKPLSLPPRTQQILADVAGIFGADSGLVLVGGPVRDVLLGTEPKDYDFASALEPDEAERRVRAAGSRVYTVGKRYGTIGFKLQGELIEVTTFRSELYDLSSRKPTVTFTTDIQADLARRDFTMNALAIRPDGSLLDPFDGASDIKQGIIRAVGKPKERFTEDPLRMMRLARFVARYGFTVDAETAKAITKQAYTLQKVSPERISTELDGILTGTHAADALRLMADLRLLPFAVPLLAVQVGYDQNSPYHTLSLWEHSIRTMAAVPAEVELRWAALLHDIGKPFVRFEKPGRSTYIYHDMVGAVLVDMLAHHLRRSYDR